MKKFFVLAATALALLACVQPEELPVVDPEVNGDGAVAFSVYAPRTTAVRAGTPGDITNENLTSKHNGFGVFAYYTAGEKYEANAKPNFMYNQQVKKVGDVWTYEPVKYWPNEYGNAAKSDEVDYVTFFAYAPYTEFEPTTGEVVVPNSMDPSKIENWQKKNIISVNKNNATGDPIIKYVVDTDPATSVDLLWGVAAADAGDNYTGIEAANNVTVTPGKPFLNLTKPANPKNDKINFNLKHSLAKVKFTIDYIANASTPDPTTIGPADSIDIAQTRIFVRSFSIDGWETKGSLNLNNTTAGQPLWKDYDGVKDLSFDQLTFNDGRKDGKEGEVNGIQANEDNQYLNPKIIENFSAPQLDDKGNPVGFGLGSASDPVSAAKNPGVMKTPQPLFAGTDGFFYIIPRNEPGTPVNVTIVYDVETIDTKLAGMLSDGALHGSTIENVISKDAILGEGVDFEPGKQYEIRIHIGMTSVKIDAVVTNWVPTVDTDVDLPDNQPAEYWTVDLSNKIFLTDPTLGVETENFDILNSEAAWNNSFLNGVLAKYYTLYPDEDKDTTDPRGHSWAAALAAPINTTAGYTGISWPWFEIDFGNGAFAKVEVTYNDKVGVINEDKGGYYWFVVSIPEDLFGTQSDEFKDSLRINPATGKAATTVKPSDFKVKLFYNSARVHHFKDNKEVTD